MLKLIRTIYVVAGLLLFSTCLSAQEYDPFIVPETAHNFGIVKQGEIISYTFVIRNTDVVPLKVEQLELSHLGMTARATPVIAAGAEKSVYSGIRGLSSGNSQGRAYSTLITPCKNPSFWL